MCTTTALGNGPVAPWAGRWPAETGKQHPATADTALTTTDVRGMKNIVVVGGELALALCTHRR